MVTCNTCHVVVFLLRCRLSTDLVLNAPMLRGAHGGKPRMGAVHPTGARAVLFDFSIGRRKLPGAEISTTSCGLPQLAPQDTAAPSKTPVIPSGPGQCALRAPAAAAKAELGIALL